PRTYRGFGRNPLAVRNRRALAGRAVVRPAVERAAQAVSEHAAAFAEMRAEVRAVRIEHVRLAGAPAEKHQVFPEVVDALDLARDELLGPLDGEPAVRDRQDRIFLVTPCHEESPCVARSFESVAGALRAPCPPLRSDGSPPSPAAPAHPRGTSMRPAPWLRSDNVRGSPS